MARASRAGWPQQDGEARRARTCSRVAPAWHGRGPPPEPWWRTRIPRHRPALGAVALVPMARASPMASRPQDKGGDR